MQRSLSKLSLSALKQEVEEHAQPERARFLQGFFKTGPGEYAQGDVFLGLTVPDSRRIARKYCELTIDRLAKLIQSRFHEHRLIALLIMVDRHQRADAEERRQLHQLYLDSLDYVNNWDLVDTSAGVVVGEHIRDSPDLLDRLVGSSDLWRRRVAIVSTFGELRKKRTGATLRMAERLLADPHSLIHKATGWLLREVGKISEPQLLEFLREHYERIPRTALRYAIERLPATERKLWLAGPR